MYTRYRFTTPSIVVLFVMISFLVISLGKSDLTSNRTDRSSKKIGELSKAELGVVDNVVDSNEHHKIIILMPQFVHSSNVEKKHPKVHHSKVIPVVHSGKVIHAHHHHGDMDHKHSHLGKAKHHHKHFVNGDLNHRHHGIGMVTHKHERKLLHNHNRDGKTTYKNGPTIDDVVHRSGHYVSPQKSRSEWYSLPYQSFPTNTGTDGKGTLNNFVHRYKEKNDKHRSFVPNQPLIRIRIPLFGEGSMEEVGLNAGQGINFPYSNLDASQRKFIIVNNDEATSLGITGANEDFIGSYESNEGDTASTNNPYAQHFGRNIAAVDFSDKHILGSSAASLQENFIQSNIANANSNAPLVLKQNVAHHSLPFTSLPKNNVVAYSDTYHHQK